MPSRLSTVHCYTYHPFVSHAPAYDGVGCITPTTALTLASYSIHRRDSRERNAHASFDGAGLGALLRVRDQIQPTARVTRKLRALHLRLAPLLGPLRLSVRESRMLAYWHPLAAQST